MQIAEPALSQRAALAASRSLSVLAFLGAHPAQPYTLTQLARELGVNASSMHGILGVMAQAGFVRRHPVHKTYSLGPMAVAVGQAAHAQNQEVELARREAARVSDAHGLRWAIVAVIDGFMVTLGRGGPRTGRHSTFVGQREPHVPPFGSIFVAWAPGTEAAWLDRAEPPLSPDALAEYRDALAAVRREGRAVLVSDRGHLQIAVRGDVGVSPGGLIVPFDSIAQRRIHYVGVPVFDAFGQVCLGMFVHEFPRGATAEFVGEVADELQIATRNVMAQTGGQPPW
jgi:DNA-binding IclR family transcriptional regulator